MEKFHDKEDDLKKFIDSLNIPKGISKKFIEQQKSDFPNMKNLEALTEKELYVQTKEHGPSCNYSPRPHKQARNERQKFDPPFMKSYMGLKYNSSDISTSSSSPALNSYRSDRSLSPFYSYPSTGYNVLGRLLILIVIIGIVALAVVLLLKFLS